tara:strand:- start:1492 stop:2019 length:528 start_codon:yes stop_codon:yes gene_type:complete
MAFKMKGFSPFTQNEGLSDKQAEEKNRREGNEDKTWKERFREKWYNESYVNKDGTKGRWEIPKHKKDKNEPYGPEQSHHIVPGKTSKKGSLSQDDQRLIQKSIEKQGHFGDIPPNLLKGYQRGTHAHRKRVAEINAHHQYLSHGDPYDEGRGERQLQKKLNELDNWETRYTDFTV